MPGRRGTFFLFERAAYGSYVVRISAESARIARVASGLGLTAVVNADSPVARLGAARVVKVPEIAGNSTANESSGTTLR